MQWWWVVARVAMADTCDAWVEPEPVVTVQGAVAESSGVAWSRTRAGVWFTHGDRGDGPVLVAFDLDGRVIEEHEVTGGTSEDWEDLAAAPCPDVGDCLYIGDIGDNGADRDSISVLVVREPQPGERKARAIEVWEAVYPGGPRDAEALLVHPCTGGILVVTKSDDGRATVYRFPAERPDAGVVLEEVASFVLDGPTAASRRVTGGAFDLDGDRAVLRTADRFWEWAVDPDAPNAHWETVPLSIVGEPESQGEAITYGPDGDLYTTSEGAPMAVARIPCAKVAPSDHICEFPQSTRCGCATSRLPTALPLLILLMTLISVRRTVSHHI